MIKPSNVFAAGRAGGFLSGIISAGFLSNAICSPPDFSAVVSRCWGSETAAGADFASSTGVSTFAAPVAGIGFTFSAAAVLTGTGAGGVIFLAVSAAEVLLSISTFAVWAGSDSRAFTPGIFSLGPFVAGVDDFTSCGCVSDFTIGAARVAAFASPGRSGSVDFTVGTSVLVASRVFASGNFPVNVGDVISRRGAVNGAGDSAFAAIVGGSELFFTSFC